MNTYHNPNLDPRNDYDPLTGTMPVRMWINQPSTMQPHHKLHGRCVLAMPPAQGKVITVYFTDGPVISMNIDPAVLSRGWPEHLNKSL